MSNPTRKTDMKKHIINRSLTVAAMLFLAVMSYAQSSNSGYFIEGYSPRYQLNPAFSPDRSFYMSIPMLGNTLVDAQSNVGMANFLYESKSKPGMLTTFMSSDVDSRIFLDALPAATQVRTGVNMDIMSIGFGSANWFTMLNMKLRNSAQVSLPKELFSFMKAGLAKGDYLIENANVTAISYIEYSAAHSHRIGENLTIGASLKILEGLAYADLNINEIDARLNDDKWVVRSNGQLRASVPGVRYRLKDDNTLDGFDNYDNFEMPSSFGLAFDLGAEYDFRGIVDGLKVSASITDIGFMDWDKTTTFETDKSKYVEFNGFKDYDATGNDNDAVLDKVRDDFEEMIKLYRTGESESESVNLDATFRLGAEYALPFVDWLSFGQLFTYQTGLYPYTESRTSVCMSPCSWFDVTGNLAVSNMGASMGLLLNLHPAGFNFFLAVDRLDADFNKQYIPLHDFGLNFSLGFNLPLGEKRND